MKSEKAKEEIEHYRRYLKNCLPSYEIGEYCRLFKEIAELAEQEAEERMREELTRWNDPKEKLPEPYKTVEIKYRLSGIVRISTAWLAQEDANWIIDGTSRAINKAKVIGWREIHE